MLSPRERKARISTTIAFACPGDRLDVTAQATAEA
jgi:hypothetical protein